MGVYFRTGENTAAGISWPVYFFIVLPVEVLFVWPVKILVWSAKMLYRAGVVVAGAALLAGREARERWQERQEDRPPAA